MLFWWFWQQNCQKYISNQFFLIMTEDDNNTFFIQKFIAIKYYFFALNRFQNVQQEWWLHGGIEWGSVERLYPIFQQPDKRSFGPSYSRQRLNDHWTGGQDLSLQGQHEKGLHGQNFQLRPSQIEKHWEHPPDEVREMGGHSNNTLLLQFKEQLEGALEGLP